MHNIASPDDFFPAFAFWYIVESSMACYISFMYFMYHLMVECMQIDEWILDINCTIFKYFVTPGLYDFATAHFMHTMISVFAQSMFFFHINIMFPSSSSWTTDSFLCQCMYCIIEHSSLKAASCLD
jgi:hypothetical protein